MKPFARAKMPRRPMPAWWWLAVACWLGSQFVVLVHGVEHGSARPAAGLVSVHAQAGDSAHWPLGGQHSHEPGSSLCKLYDQLGHADVLAGTPALSFAQPQAAPVATAAAPRASVDRVQAVARGPPVLS
jgi:hypothetical protein